MKRFLELVIILCALATSTGCRSHRPAEVFGKTFYLNGAGNWGLGAEEIRRGLADAGYRGDVEEFAWTLSFNPLFDQWNLFGAKWQAARLARRIEDYRRRYPENEIHLVALSAGTGLAIWALERLDRRTKVGNVFLLASSLSHDYDVSKALARVNGRVLVYYSPHDLVLASVRVIGTIDGRRGVDSAGLVGLTPPPNKGHRVLNTPWSRRWVPLGWKGGHTDCVNRTFAREEIARHILTDSYTVMQLVRGVPASVAAGEPSHLSR